MTIILVQDYDVNVQKLQISRLENATEVVDHSIDRKFEGTSNREYYTLLHSRVCI